MSPTPPILNLPPEILSCIIKALPLPTIRALSRTCKRLHALLDYACDSASDYTLLTLPHWHPNCELKDRFRNAIQGKMVQKALLVIQAEIKWVHGEWQTYEYKGKQRECRGRGDWALVEEEGSELECSCAGPTTVDDWGGERPYFEELRVLVLIKPTVDPPTGPPGKEYEHPPKSVVVEALQKLFCYHPFFFGIFNLQVHIRTDTPEHATTHSRLVSRAPFMMAGIELESLKDVLDYGIYSELLQSALLLEPREPVEGEKAPMEGGLKAMRAKLVAGESLEGEEAVCVKCATRVATNDPSLHLGPRMWRCSFVNRVKYGTKFPGDEHALPGPGSSRIIEPPVDEKGFFSTLWDRAFSKKERPPAPTPPKPPRRPQYSHQWHRYPEVAIMVRANYRLLRPTSAQFILSHLHLEGIDLDFESFRVFGNFCIHRGRLILRDVRLKTRRRGGIEPDGGEWIGSPYYTIHWHTFASRARWAAGEGGTGWNCELEGLWEENAPSHIDRPRSFARLSDDAVRFVESVFAGPRDWRHVPEVYHEAKRLAAVGWHTDCGGRSPEPCQGCVPGKYVPCRARVQEPEEARYEQQPWHECCTCPS